MNQRRIRVSSRPVVGAVLLAAGGLTAAAADGPAALADQVSDTTQANVAVASAISLTGLTPSFTLSGLPNTTATQNAAVSYTVTSNNAAGYTISVRANDSALQPQGADNPDVIPVGNLELRPNPQILWRPVTTSDQVIRNVDSPSAGGGDTYATDYRVHIPNVRSDTYSVNLTYTAATK
ncbi:hypothetical protein ACFXOM_04670 [Streptomyces sp. NPDC059169]|uniref:hypothetical protein n=1 Tax=Streptomyces sp. NPDC059169 TaxID=3346754 RepID=UPI0036CD26C4